MARVIEFNPIVKKSKSLEPTYRKLESKVTNGLIEKIRASKEKSRYFPELPTINLNKIKFYRKPKKVFQELLIVDDMLVFLDKNKNKFRFFDYFDLEYLIFVLESDE